MLITATMDPRVLMEGMLNGSVVAMTGKKHAQGKVRYDLFPVHAEEWINKVLTHGAEKYGDDNWRFVEDADRHYYSAARRHLEARRKGEVMDPETGMPHLAHAICSLIFLLEIDQL